MKRKFICITFLISALTLIVSCVTESTVSGTARQCSQPLAGITVQLERIDTGNVVDEQSTDANGEYTFVVEASGSYRVVAVSGGHVFEPLEQFVDINGEQIAGIDFGTGNPNAPLAERLQCVIDRLAMDPTYEDATYGQTGESYNQTYKPLGISAAVYSPVHGMWHSVAGLQEEGGTPVTTDMLFGAGSITKTFIAALALTYSEDAANPLDLSDTIGCNAGQTLGQQCWFSEAELPSSLYIPRDITVEELLFQTSGLRSASNNLVSLRDQLQSIQTPAQKIKNHDEQAGTKTFSYCNLNYTIVGVILEKIIGSGSTVAQEIQNLLTQRGLNLPDTYLLYPDGLPSGEQMVLGHAYFDYQGLFSYYPPEWRNENDSLVNLLLGGVTDEEIVRLADYAGSLATTADDLAKWAVALYEETSNGSSQILSAANRAIMLQNIQTYPAATYGAGAYFYAADIAGHGGSAYVYKGMMKYYFSTGEAAVILLNKDNVLAGGYLPDRHHMIDLLLTELHR